MTKLDDELQTHLENLENGIPLEEVLKDVPPAFAELEPLIQLATTFRQSPIPEPKNLPETLPKAERLPVASVQSPRTSWIDRLKAVASLPGFRLAGATMAAMVLIVAVLGFGFWLGRSRAAQKITLIEVNGLVEVASDVAGTDWKLVENGTKIKEGQRIHTGVESSVTLVFFEGSRAILGADTDVILSQVAGDGLDQLVVTIDQVAGETFHSVVPLQGEESAYRVNTLAGSASVHGTTFQVAVPQQGHARFAVGVGEVLVTSDGHEILLSAGQVTLAETDEPLVDPSYGFTIKGVLTAKGKDAWAVGDVPFQVSDTTHVKGNPEVGDFVLAVGRVMTDDDDVIWIADMVKPMKKEVKTHFSFTGILTSMDPDPWSVNGKTILVDDNTEIDPDIALDTPVEVKFVVLGDDSWLALSIESLSEEPVELPPVVTDTITPTATVTPTLTTDCVGNPQPHAQTLAESYSATYDEIMGWFCQGYGFGEIELAYDLSAVSSTPVAEIFEMRASGMGWGEIKALLEPSKTPKPTKTPKPSKTPKIKDKD